MKQDRAHLEQQFLRLCRLRGPAWIESIIRPLGLTGATITVCDIPTRALNAAVTSFSHERRVTVD